MKKLQAKPLAIHAETVRALTRTELGAAAIGGGASVGGSGVITCSAQCPAGRCSGAAQPTI